MDDAGARPRMTNLGCKSWNPNSSLTRHSLLALSACDGRARSHSIGRDSRLLGCARLQLFCFLTDHNDQHSCSPDDEAPRRRLLVPRMALPVRGTFQDGWRMV